MAFPNKIFSDLKGKGNVPVTPTLPEDHVIKYYPEWDMYGFFPNYVPSDAYTFAGQIDGINAIQVNSTPTASGQFLLILSDRYKQSFIQCHATDSGKTFWITDYKGQETIFNLELAKSLFDTVNGILDWSLFTYNTYSELGSASDYYIGVPYFVKNDPNTANNGHWVTYDNVTWTKLGSSSGNTNPTPTGISAPVISATMSNAGNVTVTMTTASAYV